MSVVEGRLLGTIDEEVGGGGFMYRLYPSALRNTFAGDGLFVPFITTLRSFLPPIVDLMLSSPWLGVVVGAG